MSKVKIVEDDRFRPITVQITLENPAEVNALSAAVYHGYLKLTDSELFLYEVFRSLRGQTGFHRPAHDENLGLLRGDQVTEDEEEDEEIGDGTDLEEDEEDDLD